MITVDEIDNLLPQTQCGECSYAGCRPYAEALVQGQATINRCPPGGVETVKKLAVILKKDPAPYLQEAAENTRQPAKAIIREEECIGCTKCIQACPVDAIVGSAKAMHSIITSECTGCGLCVEPCPVDCIEMTPLAEHVYVKTLAKKRFHVKQIRLLREEHEQQKAYREKRRLSIQENKQDDMKAKQNFILEALARSQAKNR